MDKVMRDLIVEECSKHSGEFEQLSDDVAMCVLDGGKVAIWNNSEFVAIKPAGKIIRVGFGAVTRVFNEEQYTLHDGSPVFSKHIEVNENVFKWLK